MNTKFYDFIKIDKNYKYKNGDFSAANGECLTAEERIEFLKAYSDFLEKKNGYDMPEKTVSDEETERLAAALDYKIAHKIRKRTRFDEMTAETYEKPENFVGWQFYQGVSEDNGELTFSDGVIPPVPCAKYEFECEKITSFAFSFVLPEEYIDEVREIMSKEKHRDFPVLDEDGKYLGMISRRNLLNMKKKQVILVDHNEKTQAVDGIGGADILEIIDHHRIGSLETMSPVFFRNQPLGCTATIIYQMYQEQNVEINKEMAGLLCSAILSDTLMYRSPTCTPLDKAVAEQLAQIADINTEEHAKAMFQAGSDFGSKTPEEIFYQDFKTFSQDSVDFGVGQLSAMTQEELDQVRDKLLPYLREAMTERKIEMVFVMLTNIIEETTYLICEGENADELVEKAYHVHKEGNYHILKGVVSRKKQLIPMFMSAMQEQ